MAKEIGQRIRESRRLLPPAGASQEELASLIHVSGRTMQAYEAGEVIPYRKLAELATVLNVPAAWILHGDKAQRPTGDLQPAIEEILEVVKEIRDRLPVLVAS